jgi:subtilisin family serine protease
MGRVARLAAVWILCLAFLPTLGRTADAETASSTGPTSASTTAPAPLREAFGPAPRALVRFAPSASAGQRAAALARAGATVDVDLPALGATRIALPIDANDVTGDASGFAALRLSRDPAIASVQLDARASVEFTPNDTLFGTDPSFGVGQWGLRAAQVDKAWDVVRGSPSIVVAVIDTGIDPNHPDLSGVWLPGAAFVSSPDPSCAAGTLIDDNGHGTHVAGIIAASANNGAGVAGAAFGVRVLPIKALDCTGAGLLSDVARSVTWATDHGARIVNISLGSNADVFVLRDAIRYAVAHNVLVVTAAGNCGVESVRCGALNAPQYPGAYPETLAVAATDTGDGHPSFSNTNAYVGISAPGVTIWSTTPTYPTTLSRANLGSENYAAFRGTSQSAPLVAAIAALVLSREPTLTVAQLTARLKSTADDLGAPGADPVFGAGRVNALRAVTAAVTPRYGATYGPAGVPTAGTIGGLLKGQVTLTNTSNFAWSAAGPNPVRLAYHWIDLGKNVVVWEGQRSALAADVPVGGTATVAVTIAPPAKPGAYVLQLDLVREGITWFSSNGVGTANVNVTITSGLGAGYAPVASAQSTFLLGATSFSVSVSNTGTATWPAAGATPVHLSYHWLSPSGQLVVWDGARGILPNDVTPGQSAVVAIPVTSPPATGPYTLRVDLVQEGVSWFSGQGVAPRDFAINVTNGFGATYAVTPPATAFLPGSRALLPVTITNTGLLTWTAGGTTPVRAAAHVYDIIGTPLVWDGERTALPNDVAPGQSVTVNVAIAVPVTATQSRYDIRVDLVREGVAWFSSSGVPAGLATINASPDYRAAVATSATTVSRSTPRITVTITNTSAVPWTTGGAAPIDVSSHWLAADGSALVWDGPRVPLGQAVLPGGSITITVPLAAPPPGATAVTIDLVAEGSRWFGSGSPKPVTLVP